MNIDFLDTKFGMIKITADEDGILSIGFSKQEEKVNPSIHTKAAVEQLNQYFAGTLTQFNLQLNFGDATEFHTKVWQELTKIPYGKTISYLDIARKLGDTKAVRAVGMANGRNPIAIVIPCHRVIGSNGKLTGYAYGLDVKRKLLALENPQEYAINGSLF